jgi:GDPmannose 4,6-dehydratase
MKGPGMRALITGITGMDGHHLAAELIGQGDEVIGLVRDPDSPRIATVYPRGSKSLSFATGDLTDELSLARAIEQSAPEIIYHLGAMSSPGSAWAMPIACAEVTGVGTARVLQAAQLVDSSMTVVVAGSLATHGPYGAAKNYARSIAADFRDRGMHVITMLMGGHHSPLRGRSYFSQKAAYAAANAAVWGRNLMLRPDRVKFGALTRKQDWGWAPDFMKVWARVVPALKAADEYVLSTGEPRGVDEWLHRCFVHVGLDWQDWVTQELGASNPNLTDVPTITAEPDRRLKFTSSKTFEQTVGAMVDAAIGEVKAQR